MKRHEIQVLKNAGLSNARVAELTGVSRRAVQRIAQEAPIEGPEPPSTDVRVGRPSVVGAWKAFVTEVLGVEADLPTLEILHRARQKGYDGGKSAFYELVARERPRTVRPMVRFEGLAGEFSQHDFGQVEVRYVSGGTETIRFFASRLKYSRWVEVRLVPDEKLESLARSLLSSFEAWGGVPLAAVFDNPKTIVLEHSRSRVEWNPTFGQIALDYRFALELCWPRQANQKGSVENLVGWVKGSFFKVRRFQDRLDLAHQLAEWHKEVNEERPCRASGVIPAERMKIERERLRPLTIPAAEYPLRFPIVVGPTAQVQHERLRYAMPPESIGFPGTLFLYPDSVRIVARQYEATHARFPAVGTQSACPEHRSAMLAKISGQRGQLYFKRQQLLELGTDAESFLTEIVHRHPRTWRGEVEILFDLLQEFGDRRTARALASAVRRRLYGACYVSEIIRQEVLA